MRVPTQISWGYLELIKVFFKANELDVTLEERGDPVKRVTSIDIVFEDDSDTAMAITFMGVKHLGLENMLCDYLIKCGIDPSLIHIGRASIARDMNQVEKEWQEYKKTIGV